MSGCFVIVTEKKPEELPREFHIENNRNQEFCPEDLRMCMCDREPAKCGNQEKKSNTTGKTKTKPQTERNIFLLRSQKHLAYCFTKHVAYAHLQMSFIVTMLTLMKTYHRSHSIKGLHVSSLQL